MHTLRARFAKEILVEFLPPARLNKKTKVIILCDGLPTMPAKRELLVFLSKKGYWVFHPRYRGSWESDGRLFAFSPDKDITDIIDGLFRGFTESYGQRKFKLQPDEIILVASSFGGATALLACRDARVTKVVAFSPMVDWLAKSSESIAFMEQFVAEGFGMGYRVATSGWRKVKTGKFFNPVSRIKEIDGSKIFIIHAKDDEVVRWRPVAKFAKKTGARLKLLKAGGHLGLNSIMAPRIWPIVLKFLRHK